MKQSPVASMGLFLCAPYGNEERSVFMSNTMWYVALEPGTTKMQDVILAELRVDDFETICMLLSTNHLKGKVLDTEAGSYLLMYGGEYERPYPSIMIWRAEISAESNTIVDMRHEDTWIVEYVWREWLMPEETDAEYVPPKQFLVMQKQ